MTAHYALSCDGANKRKADTSSLDSNVPKKPKKDTKKGKSTREQDRILLENFVKYGILPSSPKSASKAISTTIPTPVSPLRTPKTPSEDQRVPEIDHTQRENDSSQCEKPKNFWRPWVESTRKDSNKTAKQAKNVSNPSQKIHGGQSRAHPLQTGPRQLTAPRHPYHSLPTILNGPMKSLSSVDSRAVTSGPDKTAPSKHIPFTPTVKSWDIRSQEFLNSFKHPVKLMWPRSQAFDYKYRDAQQLLHAFPVQAAIGFYDDQDNTDDKLTQTQFRQLSLSQRCAPVLN